MSVLYLLILGFISFTNASKWSVLKEIDGNSSYSVASDKTGHAHFALCGFFPKFISEYGVFYTQVKIDTRREIVGMGTALDEQCKATHISVDDEAAYYVYQIVNECGIGSYACSRLFMAKRARLGVSYTIPVEQPTTNVSFSYNPLIVHDPVTLKVWVAYKSIGKENPTKIKVANKEAYKDFSNVTSVVSITNQSTIIPGGFSMARTSWNSLSKLQLAWQVESEGSSYFHKICFASSLDGLVWSTPKVIAETDLKDHNSPFTLIADEASLYLIFARTDSMNRGIWIIYSNDQGNNWSRPKRISMQVNYVSVGATICTVEKKKRLYMLAQRQILEYGKDTFWYQEIDTKKVVALGNPYGEEFEDCYNPALVCSNDDVMLSCRVRDADNKDTIRLRTIKL